MTECHHMSTPNRRPRIIADAPEHVVASTRRLADRVYRGSVADTVVGALALFQWHVRQRTAGRRVIAVDPTHLPQAFEEPVIPGLEQAMADGWTWLVERPHPWRRQLWLKGRNMTAGSLVRAVEREEWTPDEAAYEFDLDPEAVMEAIRYVELHGPLIEAEEAEDRMAGETAVGDSPVAALH